MSVSQPHHQALNVTLAIDEEVEHAPPTILLSIAFALSFIPLVGVIGGVLAGWDIVRSKRQQTAVHGLAYAALALQLLYGVLGVTLYLVVFQLPLLNRASLSDPAVQVGQRFLLAVRAGEKEQITNLSDAGLQQTLLDSVAGYQKTIQYNPQNVTAETISKPTFQDKSLAAYGSRPASVQIWRVGTGQSTAHYFILTLGQTAEAQWRVVGVLGLDAVGDQSARTVARQIRNTTFGL